MRTLTPHMTRILALVAEGKKNKEIAAILGLAQPTIANQMETIFMRLRARHRAHAVAIGMRTGVLR